MANVENDHIIIIINVLDYFNSICKVYKGTL